MAEHRHPSTTEKIPRDQFNRLCPDCLLLFVDELDGYGLVTTDLDLLKQRIAELQSSAPTQGVLHE